MFSGGISAAEIVPDFVVGLDGGPAPPIPRGRPYHTRYARLG